MSLLGFAQQSLGRGNGRPRLEDNNSGTLSFGSQTILDRESAMEDSNAIRNQLAKARWLVLGNAWPVPEVI